MKDRHNAQLWKFLGAALISFALLVGAAIPAAADDVMRVTFVRHGESAGNASGLIDTKTPGPVLTASGQQQAQAVADLLGDNNYDAIYASTMVRTQLTAAPMSQYLGLPMQVLPGLQEIEAGSFEGTPESQAAQGYALIPLAWAIQGNLDVPMPGTSAVLNGHVFEDRVNSALQTIYDNGDRNPVVFSHGGTIMFWTMMNAMNLTTPAQKIALLQNSALGNTDYVVVEGNPVDGWTLVNWNGQEFAPEPTLSAQIKLQKRTLKRQLAAAWSQVVDSLASGDFATIATAINRGVADAKFSITKYHRAVNAAIIGKLQDVFQHDSAAPSSVDVPTADSAAGTKGGSASTVTSTTNTEKLSTLAVTPDTDTKKSSTLSPLSTTRKPKASPALGAESTELSEKSNDEVTRVAPGKRARGNSTKNGITGAAKSGTPKSGTADRGSKQHNAA